MALVINQGPRLHKQIGNNVYTTSHKNLIKILTASSKITCRLSQNGSNYKTPRTETTRTVDLVLLFLHETGAKTAVSERLITKSVGRIGCFALAFNCEVKFNLTRRGHKMCRGPWQTITFPLGSIELRKWLLRDYTLIHFSREKGRVRSFSSSHKFTSSRHYTHT